MRTPRKGGIVVRMPSIRSAMHAKPTRYRSMSRLSGLILSFFALMCGNALASLPVTVVGQLAAEDVDARIAAIRQLATEGGVHALPALKAMAEDNLYSTPSGRLFILSGEKAVDAVDGRPIELVPQESEPVGINNRIRIELANAIALLELNTTDRDERRKAAIILTENPDFWLVSMLAQAITREEDAGIRDILTLVHAKASLTSPEAQVRLAAVQALGEHASPDIKGLLTPLLDEASEPDAQVRLAARTALAKIESTLALRSALAQIFTGLSLGSILLLAALGLAITYGVMGVINMAHGELLMIGAYTAYLVQTLFRAHLPGYFDWYVIAAIPAAFLVTAVVGMLLERTVIRHLYGRPLETLLATWGLSLILIQTARMLFGAQNVEVANPAWLSGGLELAAGLTLPWNRIFIIAFTLIVLAMVWFLLQRTRLGLFVRAVTQNRAMAGCVGVPTARVDTLAFGLGAGIAGLGGVALSQIANVGPGMGQGYIVDSFMVVVLGGVGQLAGTVWAALSLGVVNKFLEGFTGAVIAKILVLVLIIIAIQKRPQGLFSPKGRSADN